MNSKVSDNSNIESMENDIEKKSVIVKNTFPTRTLEQSAAKLKADVPFDPMLGDHPSFDASRQEWLAWVKNIPPFVPPVQSADVASTSNTESAPAPDVSPASANVHVKRVHGKKRKCTSSNKQRLQLVKKASLNWTFDSLQKNKVF